MDTLISTFQLSSKVLGHLTSAVQFGFIFGTLFFAIYAFADRFSPSQVFFVCSIAASLCNLGMIIADGNVPVLYASRFFTGFFLAGIYPVGMKIAADYFDKDLGKALGYLLGALVLGTAFPHLLKSMMADFKWEDVLMTLSVLSIFGGTLILLFIPDGPFRKYGNKFDNRNIFSIFKHKDLRIAAFGYFGHMWELYAFWTFIPVMLVLLVPTINESQADVSRSAFYIIASGSFACVLGGYLSKIFSSYKVAYIALVLSGTCCLISPLVFTLNPAIIFVFLIFWGMVVIMDSPQFSTLIAQSAPAEVKGSALTLVNCIGFAITIISIQLLNVLSGYVSPEWLYFFLLPGPALGLLALWGRKATDEIM